MKGLFLSAAVLGGFAALSLWNYRRFVPKPKPMGTPNYPVEVRKMPIQNDGHTLYGELLLPKGAGDKLPTIICSHGYNGSYHYFRDSVGMCMAMSGFAVYCFDFYGGSAHGKSGGTLADLTISSECGDLDAVISCVKTKDGVNPDQLFLWGESQGGFVTALTAARHTQDVRAAVLFYPAFCAPEDMRARYPSKEAIPEKPQVLGKNVSRAYCEELFDLDAYSQIGQYTGPVLIVHGDADKTVNVRYGEQAAGCYSNAEFTVLPGEDHGFSGKGKLKATALVYDFLKQYTQ